MSLVNRDTPETGLRTALTKMRGVIIGIAAVSGVINLLALTGSLYMLQVYDRVLTSHSCLLYTSDAADE